MIKNTYFYGKIKNRNNYIKNFCIDNSDRNIMIIDLEKDINGLYELTVLNSIKTILLNTEMNNIFYYLDFIPENKIDTLLINGYQNINENNKEEFISEIDRLIKDKNIITVIFSEKKSTDFKANKKMDKVKSKNIEKKIFKINKKIDLNEDSYFIKRGRNTMIGDKVI